MLLHNAQYLRGGFLGVDVFFTLSGFLITALLLQEWRHKRSVDFKAFYARRALRLLPALLTMLAVTLLLPGVFYSNTRPWRDTFTVLAYITNWVLAFGSYKMRFHEHTWSLTVEEQFYVVWPLTLIALLKLGVRQRWILLCVLAGIATSTALRFAFWTGDSAGVDRIYYGLDTRFDSLLFGCLAGLLLMWDATTWIMRPVLERIQAAVWPATAVLVGLLLLAPDDAYLTYTVLLTLAAVAVTVILLGAMRSSSGLCARILENTMLGWIGRISYGLYIWHSSIFHMLNTPRMSKVGITEPTLLILRFTVTFAVAALSYYLIERPCLRLKNRFTRDV